jgi:uncharacterized small protein (DUF1192 family)
MSQPPTEGAPVDEALRQLLSEANDKIAALVAEVERLRAQRLLDNEDLARAYDMGRDKERAAVVAWLRSWEGLSHWPRTLAASIERGEHRSKEGE